MLQPQALQICENDFYQHLTQLIRIFKQIIFSINDIASLIKQDNDYEINIKQLQTLLKKQQTIIQKYSVPLESEKDYLSAYQRFICRLIQILIPYKNKINKDDFKILIIDEYFTRLESCINFYKKQCSLSKIFTRIFAYTSKFCEGCEMLLSCCTQNEAVELLKKQAEQQSEKSEQQLSKIATKNQSKLQSQSNFHKVMVVFNKRFGTISCLDLDYNVYKSYCFMSRNDTDEELFKDFTCRNAATSKAISRYSRIFGQFIKRKQKNILRKNRFRELKQNIRTNQQASEQIIKTRVKPRIVETASYNSYFLQKKQEYPNILLPVLKQEHKKILQPQIKRDESRIQEGMKVRGNYQMKNIYLTINKFHDKLQGITGNRFMLNHSLNKNQESSRKYSPLRIKDSSLKAAQTINKQHITANILFQNQKDSNDNYSFDQMIYQTKMAISPRVPIIHKCHDKKGQKRNIRITNLTFRGLNVSKLNNNLDPEKNTIS